MSEETDLPQQSPPPGVTIKSAHNVGGGRSACLQPVRGPPQQIRRADYQSTPVLRPQLYASSFKPLDLSAGPIPAHSNPYLAQHAFKDTTISANYFRQSATSPYVLPAVPIAHQNPALARHLLPEAVKVAASPAPAHTGSVVSSIRMDRPAKLLPAHQTSYVPDERNALLQTALLPAVTSSVSGSRALHLDSGGEESPTTQSISDFESSCCSPENASFQAEKSEQAVKRRRTTSGEVAPAASSLSDKRSAEAAAATMESNDTVCTSDEQTSAGCASRRLVNDIENDSGCSEAPLPPSSSSKRARRPVERYQIVHDYKGKKSLSLDDYLPDELLLFSDDSFAKKASRRRSSSSTKQRGDVKPRSSGAAAAVSKVSLTSSLRNGGEGCQLSQEELLSIQRALQEDGSSGLASTPLTSNERKRSSSAFNQPQTHEVKSRRSSAANANIEPTTPSTPTSGHDRLPSSHRHRRTVSESNHSQHSIGLDQSPSTSRDPHCKPELDEAKADEKGVVVGRIVWAKLTARCKAWPAMTIMASAAAQHAASPDCQWVFWYGEHKVSEVQMCRVEDFDVGFQSSYKAGSGQMYSTAVLEALQDCWRVLKTASKDDKELPPLADEDDSKSEQSQMVVTAPPPPPDDFEQIVDWARESFDSTPKLPSGAVTEFVGKKLAAIVEMINSADDSSESESDGEKTPTRSPSSSKNTANNRSSNDKRRRKSDRVVSRLGLWKNYFHDFDFYNAVSIQKVRAGLLELDDICLSCDRNRQETSIQEHPLFQGGLCTHCQEYVKESFFSFGGDGTMSYCVICGNGGELLVCDTPTCGRTYCTQCVELLGNTELLQEIEQADPWLCFLCDPPLPGSRLLIRGREDWKQRLMSFYQKPSRLHNLPNCQPDRRLRVLSLFDGIGTAKVVLDNLRLDVEVYYSVEIEDDAIQVVNLNHGDTVIHLGDIRSLTEEKLAALGRIDLLVGGSPCNDLALVNPARKGLYDATGTGILFFDFYRILMTLMVRQEDPVLWLFENVVHMNKETKEAICRFLECEPVKLDAGVFSAQSRARYFWGNIPGMYCPISPEMMSLNISLQDVLAKGRSATVGKIRTVTTRGASLLQGKNEDMHAVVMNGQSDKLWPTELERVFGLPVHYTDAGNLAPGKRQKLLGRSWCVPVIEYLLKPLTHLFAVKPEPKKCCCSCSCK